jgi:mono/diheme cytochrome c family protein
MNRITLSTSFVALSLVAAGCASQSGPGTLQQSAAAGNGGITFHNQVSRILQENCQACHRAEGGAPFALVEYGEVFAMRNMIRNAVEAGRMPPWFADPAVGHFSNDASLDAAEKQVLLSWINAGAPEGDPRMAPVAKTWPKGWNIGEPSLVLQIPEAIRIPGDRRLPYQNVEVRTTFTEDKWVQAMQIKPTVPAVVHHVLVFIDEPPAPGERARQQNALEGFYAAYGPGGFGIVYPDGMAKRLKAGSTLRFQLHYEPNGQDVVDQTELGFVFADAPPARVIETRAAANARFVIPAGHPNYEVSAEYRFTQSGELLGLVPHMHIRGKAFRYDLIHADGREEVLMNVPSYNFHWQLEYLLETPVKIEPGMRIRATGWFDNSAENPHNPDHTKDVPFGPQTDDEMMIGYFHFLVDNSQVTSR